MQRDYCGDKDRKKKQINPMQDVGMSRMCTLKSEISLHTFKRTKKKKLHKTPACLLS